MMTRKELVWRALDFEEVPRIPVMTMSGTTWALRQENLSPDTLLRMPDAGAGVILKACERLDVDIVYGGRAIPHIILRAMGGILDNSRTGLPGQILKKPLEDIRQIHEWTAEMVMERLREDEQYRSLLLQTRIIAEETGQERFVGVGSFGPFTTAGQMIGVEQLMACLYDEDYEEDVNALLELAGEVTCQVTDDALKAGGSLVFIAEPVSSGDLISEEAFERWSLPALKKLRERFSAESFPMILHICGRTEERIRALADTGISALSLDSLELETALSMADGKIAIMGNLSPVKVLERTDPQTVYQKSMQLCKTAGLHGGFLLSPGCDLTPDTAYDNIYAMVQASRDMAYRE